MKHPLPKGCMIRSTMLIPSSYGARGVEPGTPGRVMTYRQADGFYFVKFEGHNNICYVKPQQIKDDEQTVIDVEVRVQEDRDRYWNGKQL